MGLSAGTRLGSYEIVGALGAGGMGEVYRAKDTRLNREVALKILPDSFTHDPERLARFRREAQVLASLNHPHIGAIYGLDEANTQQFLVLELVDGETLDKRIARGPIPVEEALPIARQIAEALETAHEKGIIHRDLKPSNIALTSDGQVKVLDFGLAKMAATEGATAGGQVSPSMSPTITSPAMMTGVGVILGTAAYMSPEQAKGRPADKRCDVWAFGCVVYEMLTGRRAFEAEDVSDTLAAVLRGTPDWSALPGETPPLLRRLLARCLEKDHLKRLRDLGDARIEIDEVLAGPPDQPVSASPAVTSRPSRLWLAWAGWVAVAVIATSWAASSWLRTQPEPRLVQFRITAPPDSKLPLGTPALSPDGRMLAYRVTTPSGVNVLHLRDFDSQEARLLAGTEGANHPIWSPDSRSLAFWVQGKVKRFDLADGSSLELAATPNVWSLAWSRQGLVLFRGPEGGLSVVPASGGSARSATYGTDSTQQTPVNDDTPEFMSDGNRFLTASRRADGSMRVDLATLESSERKTVVEQTSGGAMVARTPHGESYLLYAKGTALVAHRFDESSGRVVGAPESIVQNIGKVGGGLQVATMTASDTGTLAYQRAGNAIGDRMVWIDRQGKEVSEMPAAVGGGPSTISPDGRYVAMSKSDQLWSLDLSRQVATQLTFGEGRVDDAVWSPDGKRVAFRRDAGIYEKDSSGSGAERLLVPGRFNAISSWSPDGRYVLVSEGPRMFMVPLGGDGKRLSAGSPSGTSREGVFSPDGKFIAYTSDESGRPEVYVQPVPPAEGKWKISSEGGEGPTWRKDGKELFFRGSNRGITAVGVKSGSTFEPAVPKQLFANIGTSGYVVSPDGQRFLMYLRVEAGTDSPITVVLNWFLLLSNRGDSRP